MLAVKDVITAGEAEAVSVPQGLSIGGVVDVVRGGILVSDRIVTKIRQPVGAGGELLLTCLYRMTGAG